MKGKMLWGKVGVAVLALGCAAGCATAPGGIAPSNIPLDGKEYTVLGPARGTDSRVRLFGLIPLSGSNSLRDALQSAISHGRGDALINITVDSYHSNWILFTRDKTVVEGIGIRLK